MRRARLIGTVGVAVLVLAGCGSLTPVTEQGHDVRNLYNILFVAAAVVFVLVEGAIVFAVVRYRRRGDMLPPQFHGNNLLEVVWTVVPLLIVAALFVLGGDTLTDFALALLVGIGVGTWSSMFVATPLLVAFEQRSSRQPVRRRLRPRSSGSRI